jgi:hypothetical protein
MGCTGLMAIQYKVYFRLAGGSWANVENTFDTEYTISDEIQATLDYFSTYEWRVDTYDTETELTTTGDTWTFISMRPPSFTEFKRPTGYDEDKVWEPGTGWVDINSLEYTGGGRYKNRVVVVGHGVIYFGDM